MLETRPPVITIMGHVDHGKTTLLDYLRSSRLVAREVGGITQHIGAYQIEVQNKKLTFIDTPGHATFNKMRERGAKITDIVVLVVAANDGVKPQTLEAIRHIKKAQVPCVVAINKIDLEGANALNVKSQLAEQEMLVSDFGGDIESVEISAKTGKGVDKLLETVATLAELLELKAQREGEMQAVVVESYKDKLKGAVADVIIQNGTLRIKSDLWTMDGKKGKVRAMLNDAGENVVEAMAGDPVQVIGFDSVPDVGSMVKDNSDFSAMQSEMEAPVLALEKTEEGMLDFSVFEKKSDVLGTTPKKLVLIVKADTQGTLEAIVQNLDAESVELVAADVGSVTDADLELAQATKARIIAFQVKVENRLMALAKSMRVKIKQYQIIYELIDDLQKQMLKLMEPTIDEKITGEAEILQIFEMKGLKIAGVKVMSGEIKKSDMFHLMREGQIIANPVVASMMKEKREVLSIKKGDEGGLTFRNRKIDFVVGDKIVAYTVEE
ncbi:translation initiation factor IF-2 [Microgenomates group bacterium]|nr:translation initiation factor IF-2 [Microgenomates group bacterium]